MNFQPEIQTPNSAQFHRSDDNYLLISNRNINSPIELKDDTNENEFLLPELEINDDLKSSQNEREADLAMYEYVHNMTSEDFQTHSSRNPDADMTQIDPEPVIADSYSLSEKVIAAVETMKPENESKHTASVEVEIDQTHHTEIHEIAPKDEIVHKSDMAINKKNLVGEEFSTQCISKTIEQNINARQNDCALILTKSLRGTREKKNEMKSDNVMVNNTSTTEYSEVEEYSWRYCIVGNCDKGYRNTTKENGNFKHHVLSHYYRKLQASILRKHGIRIPKDQKRYQFSCQFKKCKLKGQRDRITLLRHYAFAHGCLINDTHCTTKKLEGRLSNVSPSNTIFPTFVPKRIKSELTDKKDMSNDNSNSGAKITKALSIELFRLCETSINQKCKDSKSEEKRQKYRDQVDANSLVNESVKVSDSEDVIYMNKPANQSYLKDLDEDKILMNSDTICTTSRKRKIGIALTEIDENECGTNKSEKENQTDRNESSMELSFGEGDEMETTDRMAEDDSGLLLLQYEDNGPEKEIAGKKENLFSLKQMTGMNNPEKQEKEDGPFSIAPQDKDQYIKMMEIKYNRQIEIFKSKLEEQRRLENERFLQMVKEESELRKAEEIAKLELHYRDELKKINERHEEDINERNVQIAEKDTVISNLLDKIKEKDAIIEEKDRIVDERDATISSHLNEMRRRHMIYDIMRDDMKKELEKKDCDIKILTEESRVKDLEIEEKDANITILRAQRNRLQNANLTSCSPKHIKDPT